MDVEVVLGVDVNDDVIVVVTVDVAEEVSELVGVVQLQDVNGSRKNAVMAALRIAAFWLQSESTLR